MPVFSTKIRINFRSLESATLATGTFIGDAHPGDGGGAHSPPAVVVAVDIWR